ncbi:hypothetical protein EDC52_101364 [Biostraticola tofi]|uniref:Uncharacterized protein n=1 Tax=Biostraticola tofi TaxID=466109 RepID=A0A4R3Z739_9GAMM|nr:hypothetical protein EDC52_101364 [Biostraticola tofi]
MKWQIRQGSDRGRQTVLPHLWPCLSLRGACHRTCAVKRAETLAVIPADARYSNSFQERPSRVIIATEAIGPQVPA